MKKAILSVSCAGFLLAASAAWSEDQIIRLFECQNLTQEDLQELARLALDGRRYRIEEDTPSRLVGENDGLKVEIIMESNTEMRIRWMEGFGHDSDRWLRNLKEDILWELAE